MPPAQLSRRRSFLALPPGAAAPSTRPLSARAIQRTPRRAGRRRRLRPKRTEQGAVHPGLFLRVPRAPSVGLPTRSGEGESRCGRLSARNRLTPLLAGTDAGVGRGAPTVLVGAWTCCGRADTRAPGCVSAPEHARGRMRCSRCGEQFEWTDQSAALTANTAVCEFHARDPRPHAVHGAWGSPVFALSWRAPVPAPAPCIRWRNTSAHTTLTRARLPRARARGAVASRRMGPRVVAVLWQRGDRFVQV